MPTIATGSSESAPARSGTAAAGRALRALAAGGGQRPRGRVVEGQAGGQAQAGRGAEPVAELDRGQRVEAEAALEGHLRVDRGRGGVAEHGRGCFPSDQLQQIVPGGRRRSGGEARDQLAPPHLAGQRPRDRLDPHEVPRQLVRGESLRQAGAELAVGRRLLLGADKGRDPFVVGALDPDDGAIRHPLALAERALDLVRVDVLAADVDAPVGAAPQMQVAVLVELPEVAGSAPAVRIGRLAEHPVGTLWAPAPGLHLRPAADPQLDVGQGRPHTLPRPAAGQGQVPALGQPVVGPQVEAAERAPALDQLGSDRLAGGDAAAQPPVLGEAGVGFERGQVAPEEERHREQRRRPLVPSHLGELLRRQHAVGEEHRGACSRPASRPAPKQKRCASGVVHQTTSPSA